MAKRPLIQAQLTEPEPRYFTNGRFTVQTTLAPYGRPRSGAYPASVALLFCVGNEGQYMGHDLTWDDAEKLHADLGRALEDRKRFKVAIRKATERDKVINGHR